MDTIEWPTATALDAAAGAGWGGLWSVLFTAQRAVGALVQVTSFAEGLDLIWLGEDLRAACDDVEPATPDWSPAPCASARSTDARTPATPCSTSTRCSMRARPTRGR